MHGEVTVLGNVFNCADDVLGAVVFVGGEAVVFKEKVGIFSDASGGGVGA